MIQTFLELGTRESVGNDNRSRNSVNRRRWHIRLDGIQHYQCGHRTKARPYLFRALRHRPLCPDIVDSVALGSLLPTLPTGLRWYTQRLLGPRAAHQDTKAG